jgi:hypothetical protein
VKLRKNKKEGQCCAMRCKLEPAEVHHLPDGDLLWFCSRHAKESRDGAAECHVTLQVEPVPQPDVPAASQLPNPEILSAEESELRDAMLADQVRAQGKIARLFDSTVPELRQVREQAEADLAELEGLELEASMVPFAEEERDRIRALRKDLEKQRTPVSKPLNAILRGVNGCFKPADTALAALEGAWVRAINDQRARAQVEKQRLLLAAQRASQEAQAAETVAAAETATQVAREALVAASEAAQEAEGTTFIDRWRFEIVDPAALPREYLCPNERKIAEVVQALGDKTSIPGVRTWNDPIQRKR